jgi:hypothetical protein
MTVAPFLPRHGVAYIPRPHLGIVATAAGAGAVDVKVENITAGLSDSTVTLRVFDPDGVLVHDVNTVAAIASTEVEFSGITIAKAGPHRVEALTSLGQIGRMLVDSAAPAAVTFVSISPTTVDAGVHQFVITGTNITPDYLVWPTMVPGPTDAVYTPTSITFTLDYTGQAGQNDSINMRKDSANVHLFQMPVTAAALKAPSGTDTTAGAGGTDTTAGAAPAPPPAAAPLSARTTRKVAPK